MKNKIEDMNQDWYRSTNRFDKLQFIKETSSPIWFEEHFLQELVTWMGEDDFNKFFKNQLVRYWEMKPEPELYASMIGE
jgi:hypothetical protein